MIDEKKEDGRKPKSGEQRERKKINTNDNRPITKIGKIIFWTMKRISPMKVTTK